MANFVYPHASESRQRMKTKICIMHNKKDTAINKVQSNTLSSARCPYWMNELPPNRAHQRWAWKIGRFRPRESYSERDNEESWVGGKMSTSSGHFASFALSLTSQAYKIGKRDSRCRYCPLATSWSAQHSKRLRAGKHVYPMPDEGGTIPFWLYQA